MNYSNKDFARNASIDAGRCTYTTTLFQQKTAHKLSTKWDHLEAPLSINKPSIKPLTKQGISGTLDFFKSHIA